MLITSNCIPKEDDVSNNEPTVDGNNNTPQGYIWKEFVPNYEQHTGNLKKKKEKKKYEEDQFSIQLDLLDDFEKKSLEDLIMQNYNYKT